MPPLALPTTASTVLVELDGRSFSARLACPTVGGPHPIVAFGHGFAQTARRYASTLDAVAARGYVVIAPNSESGPLPRHGRLADDLWHAIDWARANVAVASPSQAAVAGHSMGGGAALITAGAHPEIDAVATLAAAETRPSAAAAAARITAPVLFVVGSRDRIVPARKTRAIFDRTTAPATFATLTGGSHCGFADSTPLFGLGCDRGTISRSAQLATTHALLADWLDARFRATAEPEDRAGVIFDYRPAPGDPRADRTTGGTIAG